MAAAAVQCRGRRVPLISIRAGMHAAASSSSQQQCTEGVCRAGDRDTARTPTPVPENVAAIPRAYTTVPPVSRTRVGTVAERQGRQPAHASLSAQRRLPRRARVPRCVRRLRHATHGTEGEDGHGHVRTFIGWAQAQRSRGKGSMSEDEETTESKEGRKWGRGDHIDARKQGCK